MSEPRFVATFEITIARDDAWRRLTATPGDDPDSVRLAGFASSAAVVARDEGHRLEAVKSEAPCADTTIVITFEDAATGTVVTVTQSGFDGGLPAPREIMEVGWRLIVADLQAYLATGVDPERHLRQWRDFGADTTPGPGGVWVGAPRSDTLAARLELREGDLLVGLAGSAVTDLVDLVGMVRAVADTSGLPEVEYIRAGRLVCAPER
jgi:hypothetical protein